MGRVKDNELLHMSPEKKAEWEKKLTGEERDEADVKREQAVGNFKLAALWLPVLLLCACLACVAMPALPGLLSWHPAWLHLLALSRRALAGLSNCMRHPYMSCVRA